MDCVLVEIATGKARFEFSGPGTSSWFAAFASDSKSFVTSRLFEKSLNRWPTVRPPSKEGKRSFVTPTKLAELEGAAVPMRADVSPQALVAVAAHNGTVHLVGDRTPQLTWPTPKAVASTLTFSRNGHRLAALRGGVLYTWRLAPVK